MDMEKDGEMYYRDLARRSDNVGVKHIFNMLADEELKHYEVIEHMLQHNEDLNFADSHLLNDVKNVFANMNGMEKTIHFDPPEIEAYKYAFDIEKESYYSYISKLKGITNKKQKKIFARLANEEKQHMVLLENLIEFTSRPQTWVENAEFNHMDEY